MTCMVGIDQYGSRHYILGKHPRKELLEKLGATKAQKVYVDCAVGAKHVGYYIKGLWITLYTAWEK